MRNRIPLKALFVPLFLLSMFALASVMDYKEKVLEMDNYCSNVHSHHWPDYKAQYGVNCHEGKSKPAL